MFPVQEPDTVNKPTSPKELTAKGVVAQMADEARLLGDVRCSWVRSRSDFTWYHNSKYTVSVRSSLKAAWGLSKGCRVPTADFERPAPIQSF